MNVAVPVGVVEPSAVTGDDCGEVGVGNSAEAPGFGPVLLMKVFINLKTLNNHSPQT